MSRNVSYFPPYSQEENVVTNAVLLLLSHVHRLAPVIFSNLLTTITNKEYDVGPIFTNQIRVKGGEGIPDALIQQNPFEIYVETKLGDDIGIKQIKSHLVTIKKNEKQVGNSVLLGLTRASLDEKTKAKFKALGKKESVEFHATTFKDLADIIEGFSSEFRVDLNLLLQEYRGFIQERGLVPLSENKLLINPCGTSYDQNIKHHIYHDQPGRSKMFCKYLGLYKDKRVSRIGKVKAVLVAKIEDKKVIVQDSYKLPWMGNTEYLPNKTELNRILGIVDGSSSYYNLAGESVRYYIVDEFVPTNFKKISKHGIQGHRYFTLDSDDEKVDGAIPEVFADGEPDIQTIADALSKQTWT